MTDFLIMHVQTNNGTRHQAGRRHGAWFRMGWERKCGFAGVCGCFVLEAGAVYRALVERILACRASGNVHQTTRTSSGEMIPFLRKYFDGDTGAAPTARFDQD